jgi:hypothetical protein
VRFAFFPLLLAAHNECWGVCRGDRCGVARSATLAPCARCHDYLRGGTMNRICWEEWEE